MRLMLALCAVAMLAVTVGATGEAATTKKKVTGQRAPAVNDTAPLLWYGELGRQYDDVVLRNVPANFVAGIHEGKIESARVPGQWQ